MKLSHLLALAIASTGLSAGAQAKDCGRVTIANMNWQSAEVLAQVDRFILARGYGCKVEVVPGDTMPTLTSMMEKSEPDVAPEAWINAVREPLDAAVKAGRDTQVRILMDDIASIGFEHVSAC